MRFFRDVDTTIATGASSLEVEWKSRDAAVVCVLDWPSADSTAVTVTTIIGDDEIASEIVEPEAAAGKTVVWAGGGTGKLTKTGDVVLGLPPCTKIKFSKSGGGVIDVRVFRLRDNVLR
jgi:hypothetical protein